MKKSLFFGILAVTGLVLASCDGGDKKANAVTALNLKPAELELLEGDSSRLHLTWEPSTAAQPTDLVWSVNDTNVVQLYDNNGGIYAVGSGSALVTVKTGDLTAQAKITVTTYEEKFDISWLYYFPDTKKELNDSVYVMTSASGTEYNCRLCNVTMLGLNSFEFSEDGDGSGLALIVDASLLFIEGGEYDGSMWRRELQLTNDTDKLVVEPYATLAGQFDAEGAGKVFQDYFEGGEDADIDWDAYQEAVYGATVHNVTADADGVSWSYISYGKLNEGGKLSIEYDSNGEPYMDYDFQMNWFYGWYGLAVDPSAESYAELLVQPFAEAFSPVYRYRNGQPAVQMSAPARKGMKMSQVLKSSPMKYIGKIQKLQVVDAKTAK